MIPVDTWPEWADRHCWDEDGEGWFYGVSIGDDFDYWEPRFETSGIHLPPGHDWRVPVMRPSAEQPAVDVDWRLRGYAYASKQATTCAGCGEHKHTPLRIDAMGGYVCLTCIDQKLGTLLGEFGYPQPAPAIDLEQFREPIMAFKREVIEKERGRRDGSPIRGSDWYRDKCRKIERLLALIDGQAGPDMIGEALSAMGNAYPLTGAAPQPK